MATLSTDTVIVGAGSSGCTLAARLSEDPSRRVLLLEAGPDHAVADLPQELRLLSRPVAWPYDWGDRVTSIRGRSLFYGRGRGVGGSSLTNGGVAIRPEPPDFAGWPAGWSWEEVLPCFRRLERDLDFGGEPWHGDDGPIPIVRWPRDEWAPLQRAFHDACLALGFPDCPDHNAPGTTGVGPIPMNRVGRARVSCLEAYLEPARGRPNLEVRGDSHVARVLLSGGRATGVELVDGTRIVAGEVVLSAGVVQDPLLLWRSGIGPADRLRALGVVPLLDLPGVGSWLTDHAVVTVAAEVPAEVSSDLVPRIAPSLQVILRTTAPESKQTGARTNDLQLTPFVRRVDGRHLLAVSVSLQLPVGYGSVTPTGPGPADPALIWWPFLDEPENKRRLRDGWRTAARILQETGLSARAMDDDDELDELIAEEHAAFYHGVGTCRMGGAHDTAVVDAYCRVLGVEGLRVVDTSVAPSVPRSNTNLLAVAIAERAAELIA